MAQSGHWLIRFERLLLTQSGHSSHIADDDGITRLGAASLLVKAVGGPDRLKPFLSKARSDRNMPNIGLHAASGAGSLVTAAPGCGVNCVPQSTF